MTRRLRRLTARKLRGPVRKKIRQTKIRRRKNKRKKKRTKRPKKKRKGKQQKPDFHQNPQNVRQRINSDYLIVCRTFLKNDCMLEKPLTTKKLN